MTYDSKTYELAEHFIGDAPELRRLCDRLAQEIQKRIEDWLEYERDKIAAELS